RNAVRGAETPDLFRKAHVRATHVLEARRSRRREWTVLVRARLHVYHHLDWGVEAVKQTPKAIEPTLSVIFRSARKSDRAGGDDDLAGRRTPALCRLATRDANHCALRDASPHEARGIPAHAKCGQRKNHDVDEPAVRGPAAPAAPSREGTNDNQSHGHAGANRRRSPRARPGRKRREQRDDEVSQSGWSQAVEKLVFKVDIERDPRGHAMKLCADRARGEPRLLIARDP